MCIRDRLNLLDASFRSFAQHVVPRLLKEGIAVLGMKPMASGAIVKNKIATPKECLTYALTLPTSAVITGIDSMDVLEPVSYTHLRAHETRHELVCRLLLEKKKKT